MSANSGYRLGAAMRWAVVAVTVAIGAGAFSSPGHALGTAAQRAACTSDVKRLCAGSLGSDFSIMLCMVRKRGQLSQRCKSTLPPI